MQQLFALGLHQAAGRDARPALDDLGDLLVRDLRAQEAALAALAGLLFFFGKLLLRLRQVAVFELACLFVLAALDGGFNFAVDIFDLLAELLDASDGVLFVFPLCLHGRERIALLGKLLAQLGKARLRQLVLLVLEGSFLHFELDDLAVYHVHFRGHRAHLRADHGARLVDEVDRLIRQEAVGDVAVRERRGGDDGGVGDLHAVEHLVAFFQTTQNGDGILHRRLLHEHGLEAALERRVFFEILPVFVQCGRADAVQLTAREHRL